MEKFKNNQEKEEVTLNIAKVSVEKETGGILIKTEETAPKKKDEQLFLFPKDSIVTIHDEEKKLTRELVNKQKSL